MEQGSSINHFDRMLGALDGLPDVVSTKAATVRALTPLIGAAQTFIVQTYRQHDKGDTIFLEYVGADGQFRLVIPAAVADTIARQREALTGKSRSRAAKRLAQERKDRGEVPGFLRGKKGK
jgi:hypothetical protein